MNREEEIKKGCQFIGSLPKSLFVEGAQWADEHPSEETIKKVLSLYDNSFKGFREDEKKKCIQYIKKQLDDER